MNLNFLDDEDDILEKYVPILKILVKMTTLLFIFSSIIIFIMTHLAVILAALNFLV